MSDEPGAEAELVLVLALALALALELELLLALALELELELELLLPSAGVTTLLAVLGFALVRPLPLPPRSKTRSLTHVLRRCGERKSETMNDGLETESTEELNGPRLSQMPH